MAPCLIYGPLPPLWPLPPPRPSVLSTAFCPLYCSLPPVRSTVPSTAHWPLYGQRLLYEPLPPPWRLVSSAALCPILGPLSLLRPSLPSTRHVFSHDFAKLCCFVVSQNTFRWNGPFLETAKQPLLFCEIAKCVKSETLFRLRSLQCEAKGQLYLTGTSLMFVLHFISYCQESSKKLI